MTRWTRAFALPLLACGVMLTGCGSDQASTTGEPARAINLAYVEWDSELASTFVVAEVLKDLGYDVKLTSVSAAVMWSALASGDVDGMVAGWLPTTHAGYLEQVGEQVDDLGPNLTGTRIGLVVPAYVTIDAIDRIADQADRFGGRIIGIEPGAGVMSKTEEAIEAYELRSMELVSSSSAAMAAELENAVENQRWIVVTGWTPHWKFSRWDLKYLDDPQEVFGGEEAIHTVVRQGLARDMPDAYTVLDNFQWSADDMERVMLWNQQEGASPEASARRWVDANPDKVQQWLPAE